MRVERRDSHRQLAQLLARDSLLVKSRMVMGRDTWEWERKQGVVGEICLSHSGNFSVISDEASRKRSPLEPSHAN